MSKRNSPMRRSIIAFITTHLTREAFGNFYDVSSLSCALIDGSDNEQCNIYCAFFTTRLHFFRSRIKHTLLSIRERGSPHACIELVLSDLTSLESWETSPILSLCHENAEGHRYACQWQCNYLNPVISPPLRAVDRRRLSSRFYLAKHARRISRSLRHRSGVTSKLNEFFAVPLCWYL